MTNIVLLNPPAVADREGVAGFGVLSSGFVYPPHTLATMAPHAARRDWL